MIDAAIPTRSEVSPVSGGTMELAVRAAQQGAADAREAAERFSRTGGLFVARFVYTACYVASYGVVFPTLVVARSIPRDNAAVRGLVDGAGAARRRAETVLGGPAGS
jgi:hypothetical protein